MRRAHPIAIVLATLPLGACLFPDLSSLSSVDAAAEDASSDAYETSVDALVDASIDTQEPDAPNGDTSDLYASAVLADNPIAYYRLDEKGGTTISSVVPSAPVGTFLAGVALGGPALISKGGASGVFSTPSGMDSNLTFGNNFAFAGNLPFTIEAWIKPTATDAYYRHVMSKADRVSNAPTNGWNFVVYGNGSSLLLWLERFSGGAKASTAQVSIAAGVTTHAVGVYTGASLILYVDGVASTAVADPSIVGATTTTAFMGSANGGADQDHGFVGDIDEVAIYDKALPPASISAHYAAGK